MGACFRMENVQGKTKEEIEKKWNAMVDQDLHENGHSYSGGIGMLGHGFKLVPEIENIKEAEELIESNHSKWDQAIAVRIKGDEKDEIMTFAIGGWCSE